MEKQPQISCSMQAFLNAATSGPSRPAHDLAIGVHGEAVQRIFRKHHEVHGGKVSPGLSDHRDDALGLPRQIGLGHDDRQLQLHQPDDDAVG
jgi:hypothetical protein